MTLADIILSLSLNLIAAVLFLFFGLRFLKPRIYIVPQIYKRELDGKPNYVFKYFNDSYFFDMYDIKVQLHASEIIAEENGRQSFKEKQIVTSGSYTLFIPSRSYSKKNDNGFCAMRVTTNANLEEILKPENSKIYLQIIAKHSLSGLSKVFIQEFAKPKSIFNDDPFKFGWYSKKDKKLLLNS